MFNGQVISCFKLNNGSFFGIRIYNYEVNESDDISVLNFLLIYDYLSFKRLSKGIQLFVETVELS